MAASAAAAGKPPAPISAAQLRPYLQSGFADVARIASLGGVAECRVHAYAEGWGELTSGEIFRLVHAARRTHTRPDNRGAAPAKTAKEQKARVEGPTSELCSCGRSAYAKLGRCERCLQSAGWKPCTACSRLTSPDELQGRRRCTRCKTQRRRKSGRGGSVWTISGGLPTLGSNR